MWSGEYTSNVLMKIKVVPLGQAGNLTGFITGMVFLYEGLESTYFRLVRHMICVTATYLSH
jgi:hypothetical protein